jgi:hypothetical protein
MKNWLCATCLIDPPLSGHADADTILNGTALCKAHAQAAQEK